MDRNKFIQEIVNPLLCLEYWANRISKDDRIRILNGIGKNDKAYSWNKVKLETEGNYPNIIIPIGREPKSGKELEVYISTQVGFRISTSIKSLVHWFETSNSKVLQGDSGEIVLESNDNKYKESVIIDDTLSCNASKYIMSLCNIFIGEAYYINDDKKQSFANALNKIISLRKQINESNPTKIMSKNGIGKIESEFEKDKILMNNIQISDSAISIELESEYNSPYTRNSFHLSLALDIQINQCVAMIDSPKVCEVESVEIYEPSMSGKATMIKFKRVGMMNFVLYINIDDDMYDDIMPQLYKLIECLEVLIEEQKETKEDMNAVSNKIRDKKESFRYICGLFLSLKDYINNHDSEDNDEVERIKDIINNDESMSGLLRLDDDSYLFTVLKYSAPLEFLSKLSIERGINGEYDVYIHHEPLGATKITEIPLVSDTDEGILVNMDRYNSMDLRISETNLKLLESDLIKVIDKLNNME